MIDRRHRKAIILSTVIAIVFCLSWLPINTLNVISDMRELEIVTAYDLAFRNLKTYKTNQNISTNNNNNNSTVKIESTAPSGDSMSQHSITILKAISKIKSIEANNIDAITVIITQALCLLLILSSACVNPILYGWLNKSFRSEFYQVFHIHSTILPNIKSSHKNITQDITSNNRNNETGHRYIHSEQAEYIEQIPNYQFVNHVTTIDTTRNNSNHKQLIMKKMKECKKSTEKRSLSSTQDSCTVFSLFTSRSVELNSTQMSSNSGSNNTTSNNNNNNNNNSNINNNNSNTNDSYDTISQTIRNSFISKTEDHSTASNEISVQIMNYEQDHAQSLANNRNTVHSNSTSVNTSLKRYFLLDKPEEDDDDECDIIPESDSITDPTHLRYLPDITSV
uniref:G_PROTEIN_RECEP_F1_2 domain-containing protein n=1 Tax=Trichobilharzia regenti TaxID=157069 RepID=A0AA85KIU2_TRIRE|nr:unnamed protein product [Trichobilharzia regenti]